VKTDFKVNIEHRRDCREFARRRVVFVIITYCCHIAVIVIAIFDILDISLARRDVEERSFFKDLCLRRKTSLTCTSDLLIYSLLIIINDYANRVPNNRDYELWKISSVTRESDRLDSIDHAKVSTLG